MPTPRRIVTLLLLIPSPTLAAGEYGGKGARSVALASAYVAVADNPWTVAHNPAGLTQLTSFEAAALLVPEQFGLAELRSQSVAAALPTSLGSVGMHIEQFGFSLYKETKVALGYATKIDWGVSAGVTVNARRISIERYGATQCLSFDLGLLAEADRSLQFGFAYTNVSGTTIGSQGERLPQRILVGTRFLPFLDFQISAEIEKDIRYPAMIKVGVEQQLFEMFAVRLGTANNPDTFSFGFAARYVPFEFAYAGYTHPQLGVTHHIEIAFSLSE